MEKHFVSQFMEFINGEHTFTRALKRSYKSTLVDVGARAYYRNYRLLPIDHCHVLLRKWFITRSSLFWLFLDFLCKVMDPCFVFMNRIDANITQLSIEVVIRLRLWSNVRQYCIHPENSFFMSRYLTKFVVYWFFWEPGPVFWCLS